VLRERIAEHIELGPYEQEWAFATAVTLINRGWFRLGSDRHARSARTYGVTTLRKRHASIRGRRVTFRFPSKNRALVRTTLVDRELADAIRALLDLEGGSRLFRFEDDSEIRHVTAPALNDYLREHLGDGFTAKDFRTWGGTLTAAVALAEHGPSTSDTEARRVLASVMRQVAAERATRPRSLDPRTSRLR
jgi:DNA topoisomerase-1